MFHLKDNFKVFLGRAAAREWNKLATFVNNLCAGDFMNVERPDVPSTSNPPRIALRYDALVKRFPSTEALTAQASTSTGGVSDTSGLPGEYTVAGISLDNSTWARSSGGTNYKMIVISRIYTSGVYRCIVLAEGTFSRGGLLLSVGPEIGYIRCRSN